MRTVTGDTTAWLLTHADATDLANPDHSRVVESLAFSRLDMRSAGWTEVGQATIIVRVHEEQTIVHRQVEGLRAKIDYIRADAQAKITAVEAKINDLLAIGYELPQVLDAQEIV